MQNVDNIYKDDYRGAANKNLGVHNTRARSWPFRSLFCLCVVDTRCEHGTVVVCSVIAVVNCRSCEELQTALNEGAVIHTTVFAGL